MYGYKITFEGFPKPIIACETVVTNYYWNNTHPENMLEISISKADYIVRYRNNREQHYRNFHSLGCSVHSPGEYSYSTPETKVNILSVIVTFDRIQLIKKELNEEDIGDCSALLLPDCISDISEETLHEFSILLHQYIHYNTDKTEPNKTKCCSILYDILYKLDFYTRKQLSQSKKEYLYNQYYIKKIHSIVQKNFHKKITTAIIAEELGISSNYLSIMYKKATGNTFSNYLIGVRMTKAEELLKADQLPIKEIAEATGFENESSFRKRFKQYFGMNIKEYKMIQKGQTLYHNKPVKKKEVL